MYVSTGYWGDNLYIFTVTIEPKYNAMEAVKSFNNEVCLKVVKNVEELINVILTTSCLS